MPTNLPRPDDTPPAAEGPVKVYILSGQSNMVGFGTITGGGRAYSSIYLSADPSVMPCRMPVGEAGLLPHAVFQAATGAAKGAKALLYQGAYDPKADYASMKPVKETTVALGTVLADLPAVEGEHTVVVKAFIEVPMSGAHEVHAGFGDSSHAVVVLDGTEVYRKDVGGKATLEKVALEAGKRYPVTITYMKGGSLAFWMRLVDLPPQGSLEALVKQGVFPWMVDEDGNWTQRNDVIYNDAFLGGGKSKPLSPTANGRFFGPELGFGYVMGTFHDEPVMLIKSCTGNRSLAWDYLPPGSERYEVGGKIYAGYKDTQSSWPKEQGEPKKGGWYAGKQYDESTAAIHTVLNNFDTLHPEYKDRGYEIAGFVWWQGHKDQNDVHASRYEQNLINLMKAWRKEFNAPKAKWVIATIGFGGWGLSGAGKAVADAQLAVSDYQKHPEHEGMVKTIESRGFWRGMVESPTGKGYHYNHNAETYMLTGDALGRAMVEMMGGKAEPGPRPPRRPPVPDKPVAEMSLAEKASLLYTDQFMVTWMHDKREPTREQLQQMAPALRPFIVESEIPAFVGQSIPGHLRRGVQLSSLISGTPPKGPNNSLGSRFDGLLAYYNAAGIHEYDWKPLVPGMDTATWQYFSFDPDDGWDKAARYRKVKMPAGMDNWYAADFEAAKAGWKSGAAPFGQVVGELKPLRTTCGNPRCRCDVMPNTLWEKEVLLLRQTFDIPALKPDHVYRLVVGGGSHKWGGEGYAVYINGKLFSELTGPYFKRGGQRGAYIFNDFREEFASGKVTIAVKSFLRQCRYAGQKAPPRGHISLWIEQARIPAGLLD